MFGQQLTALFDDDALNAIVSTDEATNKQGHIAWFATASLLDNFLTFSRDTETTSRLRGRWTPCLGVMISRLVRACCFKLKWTLTVRAEHRVRDVSRKEKMSDGVLTVQIAVAPTALQFKLVSSVHLHLVSS